MSKKSVRMLKRSVTWLHLADKCGNCTSFEHSVYGQPPIEPGAPGIPHKPSRCAIHAFNTGESAWCQSHTRIEGTE